MKFVITSFTVLLILSFVGVLEAQTVYRDSRVQGGTVVTDYRNDYLPGRSDRGRPVRNRKTGKIEYMPKETNRVYQDRPYREGTKIVYPR